MIAFRICAISFAQSRIVEIRKRDRGIEIDCLSWGDGIFFKTSISKIDDNKRFQLITWTYLKHSTGEQMFVKLKPYLESCSQINIDWKNFVGDTKKEYFQCVVTFVDIRRVKFLLAIKTFVYLTWLVDFMLFLIWKYSIE